MQYWILKVWDGYSHRKTEMFGTYNQIANICRQYPPAYIWTIEPK